MEKDLRVLEDIKSQIEKAKVNWKKSPKQRITYEYIDARLESLEEQFKNFTLRHTEMISEYGDQAEVSKVDLHEVVFESYLEYKVDLKNALSKLTSVGVSKKACEVSPDRLVKLPKIILPTFSGKYTEWASFRDLFTSLVHNNKKLDDVQRLHYLKTQLSGEAEQLIRNVRTTENNYKKCWDILELRYNNKKFMSSNILKRLFGQRNMNVESSSALKELRDVTNDCLHELTNMGIDTSTWDVIIIFIVSSKLDVETRKQWELQVNESSDELPSIKQFYTFLETRFRALESIEPKIKTKVISNTPSHTKVMHSVSKLSCPHCSDNHRLHNCKKFSKEDSNSRRNIAQTLKVCFNCLGMNHTAKDCRIFTKCRICQRKHHTLLHPKDPSANEVGSSTVKPTSTAEHSSNSLQEEINTRVSTHFANAQGRVLLATALVRAESKDGSTQILRALLDQGSQASFITESAAQLLRLNRIGSKITITGIGGGSDNIVSRHVVKIIVRSWQDPSFTIEVKAHVLKSLTSVMPETKLKIQDWSEINTIQLADPGFNTPNKIDLLLGAEVYAHILKEGLMKSPKGTPVAQNTHLGWIVSGYVSDESSSHNRHNVIIAMHAQVDENDMLKRLWELDAEPSVTKKILTPEEQACEEHYKATVHRDDSGRYVVRLPFRCEDPPCKYGNSRSIAIKRLRGLEIKLARDVELKQHYSNVINEYLLLGHMERITDKLQRNREDAVYLPHHAVVRYDKLTTKVRVVYDASCKGTNGVSLNDTLMVGPTLQADLRHIVLRWRRHPVCLAADIVKMYRQIKVADEDLDYQRIVWRDDPSQDIQEFRLLTVTFGTSCAPYLAVKSLHQLACDEGIRYPLAAEVLKTDFYMDDLMTGCQTENQAFKVYTEITELLKKGGFTLQKWTSNKVNVLNELNEETGKDLEIKMDEITKVLGLTWNRSTDDFHYSVTMAPPTIPVTKRTVISEISRLYDPLGWIAPCIILSKVFIQKLWITGIGWDDELPSELLQEWVTYRRSLRQLVQFHIPRWIGIKDDNLRVELHGFGDASNIAYAAAVYCRVIDSDGKIYCNLVTAKTKVAPIKQISIPRLELCGAVLTAKLLTEVAQVMNIPKSRLHAWTDSTVVLAWLNDHPSRWKTYVANRTLEILSLLDNSQWAHVQSRDNPADIASRGASPNFLMESILWKQGPSWLGADLIEYPRPSHIHVDDEIKPVRVHLVKPESEFEDNLCSRFSSLKKLIRVIAFCKRYVLIVKGRKANISMPPYLSVTELQEALFVCIRNSQQEWFATEIHSLKSNQPLSKRSSLYRLNPFIDHNDLVRVGGRIERAQLVNDSKHPIIVSHHSSMARLIVADAHEKTFHGGHQLVLNFIRTRYWISRVKNIIRGYIYSCVPCIRHAAATRQQLMGELPACRLTPSKPFLSSGVDYAGPITMRISKGRGQRSYKGYICLFVCMATRAVHIEAVSDLTTVGFLAAFKRFVSRRGHCRHLWSDNGTNFVGAAKELRLLFDKESKIYREIAAALANNQTEWHFIPPHAPNFGGLWEAGIKSVKHHLKRVVGDSTLTFEEMSTVLSQIEACLNSRPISQGSSDPDDPVPLTPGHFLTGHPLVVPPDYNFESATLSTLRRWQLTQRMVQHFWRRWKQEYLTQFFQRHKWAVRTPDYKIDDIVLIKEDNLPPAKWLYGRIVQLHPGKDNLTRVVTIRCKGTTVKRPTSKLCLLPVGD